MRRIFWLSQRADVEPARHRKPTQCITSNELAKKGVIVIATVQGDVHSVGKNLVAVVLKTDPLYRQVVRDSQRQWWDEHPGYKKQRRQQHPEVVAANRQRQRQRDQKRRIQHLVRNNLALDLKASAAGVWLLTPPGSDLDRNNLASAQVLIFQPPCSTGVAIAVS